LGCAGSGKTTLARQIAARLDVPMICLDEIRARFGASPDWSRFRTVVAQTHAGEAWVSDGNFAQVTFDLRLPRADLIVWLDRPKLLCVWRACRRVLQRGEAHRTKDLGKVLGFIWNFDQVNKPIIEAARLSSG